MDLTRQTFIFTSQHLCCYRDESDHPYQDHFTLSFSAYFFVFCKYWRKYKCGIKSHFKNSCRKKFNFQCPCGQLNPRPCAYEPMIHFLLIEFHLNMHKRLIQRGVLNCLPGLDNSLFYFHI